MIFRILILFIFCAFISNAQVASIKTHDIEEAYTLPDDTNKVIKLLSLCTEYYDINNDSSLILANKALALSEKIKYKRGEVESLFRIGNDYFFLNHQQKAIHYFEQTIIKAEIISAQYWVARSYRQIASIKIANGNYDEAIILNNKGLKIHLSMSDSSNLSQCYNRLGFIYMKSNKSDSAFIYIQKAININIRTNNLRALARSYRNLASLHMTNKDLESSEYYFKKTLSLQKENSKKHEILVTDYKYAQLLIQQKNYKEAIQHLNHGIKLARKIKLLKNLPNYYKELSLAKELAGNHKEAIKYYKQFLHLNDSIQFKEEQIQLSRKTTELELLQLKNLNLVLQQEKEARFTSNDNREKLTLFLVIILIILVFLILKAIRKKDLILEISNKEKILSQKLIAKNIRSEQFNAIKEVTQNHEITKEQIAKELHDELGGTLTAIKMNLMQLKKSDIITKIIAEVGEIASTIRFISHDLHPPLLKTQAFCVVIQDYLSHIFNNTGLELSITLLPKADINNLTLNTQLTLYRIIQELCANIINHSKASKVSFQLIAHTNDISLIIEDDGIGFTISYSTLKKHTGLTLIKERLKIIDGELEIDSHKDKGSAIYIFIPIITTTK